MNLFHVGYFAGVLLLPAVAVQAMSEGYVNHQKLNHLGRMCDQNVPHACQALANETNGQCASPNFAGGCHFNSLETKVQSVKF